MDPGEWHAQEYIWQNVDDQYARLVARNTFYTVFVGGITQKTVTVCICFQYLSSRFLCSISILHIDRNRKLTEKILFSKLLNYI